MKSTGQIRPSGISGVVLVTILGGLLIAGLWSLRSIPFYQPFWGLDFQNIYTFHHCPDVSDLGIYGPSGGACGDVSGRPFRYPPLIYYVFIWVRPFGFGVAKALWVGMSVGLMVLVGLGWAWLDGQLRKGWRPLALGLFWALLLAQFPFVFALERGNNDVIPVVLWTISAVFFARSKYPLAGVAAGLAVAVKIYPVIALAVVGVGALRMKWQVLASVALGAVVGGLLASVFWPSTTLEYLTEILPGYANQTKQLLVYSHPLRSLSAPAAIKVGLGAVLLGSWALAAWRRLQEDPLLVFAGGLAISTYFASVSWDYNLITTYPLLLLVTSRALQPDSSSAWGVASIAAVAAIASGRGLFTPDGQLILQIASLVGIASLVFAKGGRGEQSRGADRSDSEARHEPSRG